jgi:hypothetical protein
MTFDPNLLHRTPQHSLINLLPQRGQPPQHTQTEPRLQRRHRSLDQRHVRLDLCQRRWRLGLFLLFFAVLAVLAVLVLAILVLVFGLGVDLLLLVIERFHLYVLRHLDDVEVVKSRREDAVRQVCLNEEGRVTQREAWKTIPFSISIFPPGVHTTLPFAAVATRVWYLLAHLGSINAKVSAVLQYSTQHPGSLRRRDEIKKKDQIPSVTVTNSELDVVGN